MRVVLYIICQCTWGILQTLLGFIVFLINIREKHCLYHGAVVTAWKNEASASLGLFLFVAYDQNADKKQKEDSLLAKLPERILILTARRLQITPQRRLTKQRSRA